MKKKKRIKKEQTDECVRIWDILGHANVYIPLNRISETKDLTFLLSFFLLWDKYFVSSLFFFIYFVIKKILICFCLSFIICWIFYSNLFHNLFKFVFYFCKFKIDNFESLINYINRLNNIFFDNLLISFFSNYFFRIIRRII